jgi:hypothetical protein
LANEFINELLALLKSNYTPRITLNHDDTIQSIINAQPSELVHFDNIKNLISNWIAVDFSLPNYYNIRVEVLDCFKEILKEGHVKFSYIYCSQICGNRLCYIYPSDLNNELRFKIYKLLKLKVFS